MLNMIQNRLNSDSRDEKGFSLIELIIVIVIIGILTAIAIPVYGSIQDNARQSAVEAAAANAHSAAAAAHTDGSDAGEAVDNVLSQEGNDFALVTEDSNVTGDIDELCIVVENTEHDDTTATAGGCAEGETGGGGE